MRNRNAISIGLIFADLMGCCGPFLASSGGAPSGEVVTEPIKSPWALRHRNLEDLSSIRRGGQD